MESYEKQPKAEKHARKSYEAEKGTTTQAREGILPAGIDISC